MRTHPVIGITAALTAAAYGAIGTAAAQEVPGGLRPPSGEVVFLEAIASGVQIYECAAKPGEPGAYEWAFRAPEASLVDAAGRTVGKHYAGPTWEAVDGSSVVGAIKARDPGPRASAIPWLLLTAKSRSGSGVLGEATHIQRVETVGGLAPETPCGAANTSQIARVPYTAKYYFYRSTL